MNFYNIFLKTLSIERHVSKLQVGIIGTGYVGLVSGVSFGELGHRILAGDIIPEKVQMINKGEPPIFENGLKELLNELLAKNLLEATLDISQVVKESDVIFICTGTPSAADGSIDITYVKSAATDIANALKDVDEFKTIVVKSTVIPSTTKNVILPLIEKVSGKRAGIDFGIGMNPEFLKEGVAIEDFRHPDRVVIGAEDPRSRAMIAELYESFDCEILHVDSTTAELIKYASNSFLAVKISYINEIANIAEKVGANIDLTAKGMGLDSRISPKFLRPGIGFGGSCFPKDVKALKARGEQLGMPVEMLTAALFTNKKQPLRAVELLESMISLEDKTVALLGLAFKPETDDMREAPSIIITNALLEKGAKVVGYDPIAKETAEKALPTAVKLVDSVEKLLQNADAAIMVTEWSEFSELTPADFKVMNDKYIVDGRRVLNADELRAAGFVVKVLGTKND